MTLRLSSTRISRLLLCAGAAFAPLAAPAANPTYICGFTSGIEGPTADRDGSVFAVNYQRQGTIGRISPSGAVELWATLPSGSIGNGLRFSSDGDLLVADYKAHQVIRIDRDTKKMTVLLREPAMKQPNDLAVARDGRIFLSDPNWSARIGKVWVALPGQAPFIAADGLGTTNGIELSPDERYLYVNESTLRRLWRFEANQDGTLSGKTLLFTFSEGEPDGMRADLDGNLFVTLNGVGKVVEISPEGGLLNTIRTRGKSPSNLTFLQGQDRVLYITEQEKGCVEIIRVPRP